MSTRLNMWMVVAAMLLGLAIPLHCAAQNRVSNSRSGHVQRNSQALGVVGSIALGANGIAYRRYLGNNFFQLSFFPLFTQDSDGSNRNWSVRGGLSLGRYLVIVERPRVNSWFAPTIALRSLVNVSGSIGEETRSQTTADGPIAEVTSASRRLWLGAGMGVEFGGVASYGLSITVDLLLSAEYNLGGFESFLPLPYAALMFNW